MNEAVAQLWRRYAAGDMEAAPSSVLLDKGQQQWVEHFFADRVPAVWLVGRQRGKSFAALMLALEFAFRTKGAVIRYCALTKDSAIGIVEPILAILLADCPKDIRPRVVSAPDDEEGGVLLRKRLWFPTSGAELVVFGTDAQSFRKGRGPKTHLQLFDECGFYQDLSHVEQALRPALQTTMLAGHGRSLYLSTPPLSPGHPYTTRIRAATGTGRLIHDTFWNNARVDQEAIIHEEASLLGQTREEFMASTYYRREFMAEVVTETEVAACPAWPGVAVECTKTWPRPTHFHGYTGHDWGGQTGDPHAALFAYVDFKASKLIVEDEHEEKGIETPTLAERWKAKETAVFGERKWDGTLWGAGFFEKHTRALPDFLKPAVIEAGPEGGTQPFLRVCDNYEQLQRDMLTSGYAMLTTAKDDKHLMVDNLNALMRQKRIIINPRCKRLLEQLATTIWNKTRSEWVRTPKDHGDLIDCLVYITRNVFWHHDPFPPPPPDCWGQPVVNDMAELAKAMTGRNRR